MTEANDRIRRLAEALSSPGSDHDDLIHAFGNVEQLRYRVGPALLELLNTAEHNTAEKRGDKDYRDGHKDGRMMAVNLLIRHTRGHEDPVIHDVLNLLTHQTGR